MNWLDELFSTDRVVLRDRYNRSRVLVQRKWAVFFFFSAYFLEIGFIVIWGKIGPIDFTKMPEQWVSNGLYTGSILVAVYSLIQLPTFLMNYRAYTKESFSELRSREVKASQSTLQNLRSELASERQQMERHEKDIETMQEWAAIYSKLDRSLRFGGSAEEKDFNNLQDQIRDALGIIQAKDTMPKLKEALSHSESMLLTSQNNIDQIRAEMDRIGPFGHEEADERSVRYRNYFLTEVFTDMFRILPVFVLAMISAYRLLA